MDVEEKKVRDEIYKAIEIARSNEEVEKVLKRTPIGIYNPVSYSEVKSLEKTVTSLVAERDYFSAFEIRYQI